MAKNLHGLRVLWLGKDCGIFTSHGVKDYWTILYDAHQEDLILLHQSHLCQTCFFKEHVVNKSDNIKATRFDLPNMEVGVGHLGIETKKRHIT